MIDICWFLAMIAVSEAILFLLLLLKYLTLKDDIDFYSEQYQDCFKDCQRLRDALGLMRVNNALNEYQSGKRKTGETVDYS